MKKEIPITEWEEFTQALHSLKKEIMKSYIGRFIWWILEGFSWAMNWFKKND